MRSSSGEVHNLPLMDAKDTVHATQQKQGQMGERAIKGVRTRFLSFQGSLRSSAGQDILIDGPPS